MLLSYVIDTMTSVHVMKSIKKQLNLGEKMNNKIDDVLDLTREISLQDGEEDIDFSVTEFGDQLLSTNDIEFLWVAEMLLEVLKMHQQVLNLSMTKKLQMM